MVVEPQGPADGEDEQPAAPGYPPRRTDPLGTSESRPDPFGRPDPFATSDPYGRPDPGGRPDPFGQTDPYGEQPSGRAPTYGPPRVAGEPSTYGQPAPYGQPGPAQPPGQSHYGQPTSATDGTSIAALVTGLLGLGIVPIVLGIIGLKRTAANRTSGRGMSIAGIILGAVGALAWTLVAIFAIIGFSIAADEAAVSVSSTQSSTDSGPDSGSATWLRDLTPVDAAAYSTTGLLADDAILATGALEAYTATYSDGANSVALVVTDWITAEQSDAWVASQEALFTAEQLVDAGEIPDSDAEYRLYTVDGVSTLVANNETVGFTMTGSSVAVLDLYQAFPY